MDIVVREGDKLDVENLKMMSNIILSYAYDAISKYPEPNREDYSTEEEYKKAYNDYLLFLVDYVSKIKLKVFSDVLDIYNESLSVKKELVGVVSQFTDKMNMRIDSYDANIKRNYIATMISCIILPKCFLIFLGLSTFRYAINKESKRRTLIITEKRKEKLSQFCKDVDDIYFFQDDLRTDYHSRKKELEKLKKMVLDGEVNKNNKDLFIERLRELIDPKSYSFEKLDESIYSDIIYLLNLMGKDVLIEQHSQFVKK